MQVGVSWDSWKRYLIVWGLEETSSVDPTPPPESLEQPSDTEIPPKESDPESSENQAKVRADEVHATDEAEIDMDNSANVDSNGRPLGESENRPTEGTAEKSTRAEPDGNDSLKDTRTSHCEGQAGGGDPPPDEIVQQTNELRFDTEHIASGATANGDQNWPKNAMVESSTQTGVDHSPTAENSTQTAAVDDNDNWLDKWDMTVRRCQQCKRAFGTQEKLTEHLSRWHAPNSESLGLYFPPSPSPVGPFGSGYDTVNIVEHGDLILHVKGVADNVSPPQRFLVASQTLWASSPVFNAMFGPKSKFQEGLNIRRASMSGHPPPVISLQDDPVAMECLLKVLFHQPCQPKTGYREILEVAIVTDKYDMQNVMSCWAEKAISWVERYVGLRGFEDAILISWVFGYEAIFHKMFTHLTLNSKLVDKTLVFPGTSGDSRTLCEETPSIVLGKNDPHVFFV